MRKSNAREIEEDSETIVVLGDKEQKRTQENMRYKGKEMKMTHKDQQ